MKESTRSLKILQFIASVDPQGGGPVESLLQVSEVLRSEGHQIAVVSFDDPDALHVRDFPFQLYPLGPAYGVYKYTPRLVPWLRENAPNYDCVIVRGLWRYTTFGVWRVLRHAALPYFVFTHGMLDPWFRQMYPLKHLKKYLLWIAAEHRVLRDAAGVLFTTEEERLLARKSFRPYRCREIVVRYGTASPPDDLSSQKTAFLREFPELQGKRIVLFLGRIHPKKGCDLLIDAFSLESRADTSLQLVIAGPDQVGWRAELEAQAGRLGIGERITWTGMLTDSLKWGAYAAAEVFVLPSHQENFGISVVEALGCAVPVLITNKINIWREVVEDGAGLVSEDTCSGVQTMLRQWLESSIDQQHTMGSRGKEVFARYFEIRSAAACLLEVLRGSLNSSVISGNGL